MLKKEKDGMKKIIQDLKQKINDKSKMEKELN